MPFVFLHCLKFASQLTLQRLDSSLLEALHFHFLSCVLEQLKKFKTWLNFVPQKSKQVSDFELGFTFPVGIIVDAN